VVAALTIFQGRVGDHNERVDELGSVASRLAETGQSADPGPLLDALAPLVGA
jgi:hypothetical protein